MQIDLNSLDLPALEIIYNREKRELENALLAGASWESVQKQRKKVTELAITIHKRKYPLDNLNPAEFISSRNNHNEGRE